MSQDFKIQNLCDHRIIREKATLKANRRDITVTYPVASNPTVQLFINNVEVNREDYEILTLEEGQYIIPRRLIRMKKRIKNAFPLIEVSYFTIIERCPKCLGVRIYDDIKVSSDGDITLVKDEAYLLQQVEKYIITRLGSNTFHEWMGTALQELAGTKITDFDLITSRVTDQVNSAIEKLRDVQAQQISAGKVLTPGEVYASTLNLQVIETQDPTIIEVLLVFTARSGKTVEYTQLGELSQLRQRLNV